MAFKQTVKMRRRVEQLQQSYHNSLQKKKSNKGGKENHRLKLMGCPAFDEHNNHKQSNRNKGYINLPTCL